MGKRAFVSWNSGENVGEKIKISAVLRQKIEGENVCRHRKTQEKNALHAFVCIFRVQAKE